LLVVRCCDKDVAVVAKLVEEGNKDQELEAVEQVQMVEGCLGWLWVARYFEAA
jgi:hypothetical protein